MLPESLTLGMESLVWPLALLAAWIGGEWGQRWFGLPRISGYGIVGFLLAPTQLGWLPNSSSGAVAQMADFALALILFELGYRVNLRWLRNNPWLLVTSVCESSLTFVAVFFVARQFSLDFAPSLLLAALSMATSPAAIVRVANELHAAGQVTERTLHLSALNCLLTVVIFKIIAGYWILASAGSLFQAVWSSGVVVFVSIAIGVAFAVVFSDMLRRVEDPERSMTIIYALAVMLLTALTTALKFSPLLAAISFGLMTRQRRVMLTRTQRHFGLLGDALTLLLFVFVATTLDWHDVVAGISVASLIIAARLLSKMAATTLFARLSGISWRKGFLTGLALTPQSVFVILLIEQSRHLGIGWINQMTGLAGLVLLLEIFAPVVTRWALLFARETRPADRRSCPDAS